MVFIFLSQAHSPKMYIGKGQKQQNQVQLHKTSSTKEESVNIYQKCITCTQTKAEEKGAGLDNNNTTTNLKLSSKQHGLGNTVTRKYCLKSTVNEVYRRPLQLTHKQQTDQIPP